MSRRPSFRRDTDLQKEFRRVNKLVQNKQSRLRVNKGLEVQGETTSKIKEFASRREINNYLTKMNKFLDKKADFRVTNEKGANMQYSEVQEVEKAYRRVNKQKKEQWDKVKDLPYKHRGKDTGLTVAEQANPKTGMGDPKYADLKPVEINYNRFKTEKEFRQFAKEKEQMYDKDWLVRQNELYRDNYIKGMENAMGPASKKLQKHIKNMDLDKFISEYYTENNAHIDFLYDKFAIQTKVKELNKVWGLKKKKYTLKR